MNNSWMSNWGPNSRQSAWVAMAFLALAVIANPRVAAAQQGPVSNTNEAQQQSAGATAGYWTAERMRNAIPKDLGVVTANATTQKSGPSLPADAVPGFAPGWKPGSGPQPDTNAAFIMGDVQPQTSPPFSPPSSPTDFGNYSPFQRYNLPMRYMLFPFSTIGKLFFTQNGNNFVCSASVIGSSTIATAGHCVHDGSGSPSGWSSNIMLN